MNTRLNAAIDVLLYFASFFIIQIVVRGAAVLVCKSSGVQLPPTALVVSSVLTCLITIALFALLRWSPSQAMRMSRRRWPVLVWAALAALGTMAPMQLLVDVSGFRLPPEQATIFASIMSSRWGWLAIALATPIAEEMVFRGAIMRVLLAACGEGRHWWAIVITALLFGVAHGNMAQFVNAFLVGLLLGWVCFRTSSLLPGIVMHFTINITSYAATRLLPGTEDMTLTEFFGGDYLRLGLLMVCLLCVLVPSLIQLYQTTGRAPLEVRHRHRRG